jgi:hypothetical protein
LKVHIHAAAIRYSTAERRRFLCYDLPRVNVGKIVIQPREEIDEFLEFVGFGALIDKGGKFNKDIRTVAAQSLFKSSQDRIFVSIHVDFDEIEPVDPGLSAEAIGRDRPGGSESLGLAEVLRVEVVMPICHRPAGVESRRDTVGLIVYEKALLDVNLCG